MIKDGSTVVVIPDNLTGRAVERLVGLFFPHKLEVIRTSEETPDLKSLIKQARGHMTMFIDCAGDASSQENATGVCRLYPGTALLDLLEGLRSATILSDDQVREAALKQWRVDEHIGDRVHGLAEIIHRGVARAGMPGSAQNLSITDRKELRDELDMLRGYMAGCGLSAHEHRVSEMLAIIDSAVVLAPDLLRSLLRALDPIRQDVSSDGLRTMTAPPVPIEPPVGYGTILIADDDGCAEEFRDYLENICGYRVDVVTSTQDAERVLENNPSEVFLCDLGFKAEPAAGRRLMKLARAISDCRLVIALSNSRIAAHQVPDAHLICAGPAAKIIDGAREVHNIIWKWARDHRG